MAIEKTTTELLDETRDTCRRKGILQFIPTIIAIIHNVYRGVERIIFSQLEDPELPECEKLQIEIHLRSEPDHILDDEERFYDKFFSSIPEDKQDLFVVTYRVS